MCANEFCGHPPEKHHMLWGACDGTITDYYGTWACMCRHYEKDTDE